MAVTTLNDLPIATGLIGTELILIYQAGGDATPWIAKTCTPDQIAELGVAGPPPWTAPEPWAAFTDYVIGPPASLRTFGDETYVCITSHTSGSSFDPTKWSQVAAQGSIGPVGPAGPATVGPPGEQGPVGPASPYIPAGGGPVVAANTVTLPSFTYSSGVMTATANGVFPALDGITLSTGQRFWHWDQTGLNGANVAYGIYRLTNAGSVSTAWTATRATDANTAMLLGYIATNVTNGPINGGKILAVTQAAGSITLGTTAIVVTWPPGQLSAAILFGDNDRMPDSTQDGIDRAVEYMDQSGVRNIAQANVRLLNKVRPQALILGQKYGAGDKLNFMCFMPNTGQSLAEAHFGGGNMTLAQEGNSLGFGSLGSTTLYPLVSTTAALSVSPPPIDGENPMYGCCGFLYELLLKENGLSPSDMAFTPVTVNNAMGATTIAQNNKGTARYGYSISQVAALQTYAQANAAAARTFGMQWYQGEDDYNQTFAYYYGALTTLASNFASDSLAIMTSQTFTPHLVTYQMNSRADGGNRYSVPRSQLQACIDFVTGASTAPVGMSTPDYFMNHDYDTSGVHIPAQDAKWMGGYAGLYWKRRFIDLLPWPPMYPIAVLREGNSLFVTYQMRAPGVKFVLANSTGSIFSCSDGYTIPPQPNAGFSAYNVNTSSPVTLSSMAIVGPATLRFTFASAPFNGLRVDYAQMTALDMDPFTFNAGNIRDNYGDFVFYDAVNRPMHNWLPAQSFLLDSSSAGFSMD